MGEKRGLGGKNVIEMTPLKLPKKYKKIIKNEKKKIITQSKAPESHQKSLVWTFLWPMGEKRGLGGKKVIEMTPP